jgi:Helix-turn-helix domain
VRTTAALLGTSEKLVRARVERRLIPFRRLGGRIVFPRDELTAYQQRLPGCSLDETLKNLEQRAEASR